ncbi:MAG: RNA-guided endonuclease TnpB family protein [Prochloraceae cyanobacterium]|nr:RNA-guided endonuclease TnpB family protein [Prochloraceae cyanobacterium]
MKARYNYRIYPQKNQIEPLAKAFGCARVVWNDALWLYKKASLKGQTTPKNVDKQVITQAKKTIERCWLSEVSNIVLQQSFRDLQQAWNNYFSSLKGKRKGKKVGKPKFKKKQSRQAIRFRKGGFSVHSTSVKLAKIGHIPILYSRPLPSAPSSVTIIKDTADRYFASFVVEINPEQLPKTDKSVGIDLGLTYFAILSDGEKIENPRLHKKMLRRIKKANRRLSKAKKDSNRRTRRQLRLAKLHAKVKDSRNDFLQKLSTRLVRENQAIAIEDLNVSGLVKNRKLSRAISDAGWYSFRSLLDAKCEKYNRDFFVIDRWEATSQKCSACGFHGGKKELNVRAWTCLHCGKQHDRDINAAKNIKAAGGLSEAKNGRWSECQTTSGAVRDESSTTPEVVQLSLF